MALPPLFKFEITQGLAWHHEWPPVSTADGEPMEWEPGWVAALTIRNVRGRVVARLKTGGGPNGTLTLSTGLIAADMTAAQTKPLPASWSYRPRLRERVFCDLTVTDPVDGRVTVLGQGDGVIRQRVTY